MWITELCKPFLISNLMNIKQAQLNYYCYTGMLPTCRPVLPAALLLVKTRQQQSPSMNAFTDNDSCFFLFFLFFKRPIHLMDNSGRRVTASDPSGPRTRIGPVNWRPSPWASVSALWWWHHFWPCRGKKRKTHQQRARGKGSGERLRRAEAWAGCRKGPWITLTSPAGRPRLGVSSGHCPEQQQRGLERDAFSPTLGRAEPRQESWENHKWWHITDCCISTTDTLAGWDRQLWSSGRMASDQSLIGMNGNVEVNFSLCDKKLMDLFLHFSNDFD